MRRLGCDKIRPLIRHYLAKDRFIIFIHDCADDRLEESIQHLHEACGWMSEYGCTHMWVLFNKQDLLPPAEAKSIVDKLREQYESQVYLYRRQGLQIKVMDTPGLSGRTGEGLVEVMNEIVGTLNKEKKPTPAPTQPKKPVLEGPTEQELFERIEKANQVSPSPDEFWRSFLAGDLPAWDHYSHLRAGFFVMYDCFARGCNVFECADEFLAHLKRLRNAQPERFRNTAHRYGEMMLLRELSALC